MAYAIVIISLFLDGILSNFIPYMLNDSSWLIPMFTLTSIGIVYPFFQKEPRKYYVFVFIIGFLYDLFYTNLLFTNAILFLLSAFLIAFLHRKLRVQWFSNILLIMLQLTTYQLLYAFLLFIFNVVPITWEAIGYIITHTLLINVIYGEILYFLCYFLPKKRRLNWCELIIKRLLEN